MAKPVLKSTAFRREREASWRSLEVLIQLAEKHGLQALSPGDIMRLPGLYRAAMSSLSVARDISLDRNLLDYLEALCARAHFQVYGADVGLPAALARFFLLQFPAAVRASLVPILLAAAAMAAGVAAAYLATLQDLDWYYTFVPADLAAGRTPTASDAELAEALYGREDLSASSLNLFAATLFSHNTLIGLLSFALGAAFGVPVILLMFYNGLILGAMTALYAGRGLGADFVAWLMVHGTTELGALILCGGAGLTLAAGTVFPGRSGRLEALARRGPVAGQVAVGAVVMFLVAALLEGFARQLVADPLTRATIGVAALAVWLAYFGLAGRPRDHGDRRG